MDYVTLIGSEDVSRAGARMVEAAAQIQSAVNMLETTLHNHRVWLDEFLSRLEVMQREDDDGH